MFTTLVVEDAEVARTGLVDMLSHYSQILVVGQSRDSIDALQQINKLHPQLLFLDIHLPGESAFELLAKLPYQPLIIFTTAYSEYALQSFDYNTVDYLLKPITQTRLEQAIEKLATINTDISQLQLPLSADSRLLIRDKSENHILTLQEVLLFESCKNHTRVYYREFRPFILKALSHIEARLPADIFFRTSRNHIINLKHIKKLHGDPYSGYTIELDQNIQIQVSKRRSLELKQLLSF